MPIIKSTMDENSLHAASVAQGLDPIGTVTTNAKDVSFLAGIPGGLVARPPTGSGGEIQSGARPRASTSSQPPWPTLPPPLAGRGTAITRDEEVISQPHKPQQYTDTTKSALDHVTEERRRETSKLTNVNTRFQTVYIFDFNPITTELLCVEKCLCLLLTVVKKCSRE